MYITEDKTLKYHTLLTIMRLLNNTENGSGKF